VYYVKNAIDSFNCFMFFEIAFNAFSKLFFILSLDLNLHLSALERLIVRPRGSSFELLW